MITVTVGDGRITVPGHSGYAPPGQGFYERFGFRRRPGENHMGAGMSMWLDQDQ